MGQGQRRSGHDPLAGSWPGPRRLRRDATPASGAPSLQRGSEYARHLRHEYPGRWRRHGTEAKTTRGHLGKEMAATRHAADRYRAQARALHPPHRHLESPPPPRRRAPAHARPRAGPAPVTARDDAYREGGYAGSSWFAPGRGANRRRLGGGCLLCSRHRPAAHPRRQGRRGRASHLRTRTLAVRRVRLQAQGGQVALPHQRVQARVPVDQCKPPPHPHPATATADASSTEDVPPLNASSAGWKHEWSPLTIRVRGIEGVRLHADLTVLTKLACALARARAVPLRRSSKVKDLCVVRCSTSRASFATTGIGVSSASRSASL